jgi:HEAT repeat protein
LGGRPLDSESVAAALELATRSAAPETRKVIWGALRNEDNPALAQPMSVVLQSDPDAAVRVEAALGLAEYRDEAGIQPALEQAALGDSSADVRLAARMAAMDYEQQQTFRLETLLDPTLTPAERLAPLDMYPNPLVFGSLLRNGERMAEVRLAYAEIISGTSDPDLKLSALMALQQSAQLLGPINRQRLEPDPAVVRALVESAEAADESVQRAALRAMLLIANQPEIRAVLESVLESEPELAQRMDIATALALPQDSNLTEPRPLC